MSPCGLPYLQFPGKPNLQLPQWSRLAGLHIADVPVTRGSSLGNGSARSSFTSSENGNLNFGRLPLNGGRRSTLY